MKCTLRRTSLVAVIASALFTYSFLITKESHGMAPCPQPGEPDEPDHRDALSLDTLRYEAKKEHVIYRAYNGPISLQGCYIYLDKTELRITRLAPSKVLNYSRCEKRLPSAFLIGVKKSGTTTLARYLDLHEQVALANYAPIPLNGSTMDQRVQDYLTTMPYSTPEQVVIANYPGYYWLNRKQLFRLMPYLKVTPKILVILRDPVERAISDYAHMKKTGRELSEEQRLHLFQGDIIKSSFEKTILTPDGEINSSLAFIEKGLYSKYLSIFVQVIPKEHIFILNGNKFAKAPYENLKGTERFLGLRTFFKENHFVWNKQKGFYCASVPSRPDLTCLSNRFKGRKHPLCLRLF